MKNKFVVLGVLVIVVVAAAITITSRATKTLSQDESVQPGETQGTTVQSGTTAEKPVQLAQAGSVEEAFQALSDKLQQLEEKIKVERSSEQRMKYLGEMDLILSEFIDNYSETPQAFDAAFEAGLVNFTLQKPKRVVRYLEIFLLKSTASPRDKKAYGHFYLAEAYKQMDKYEDAESEYKVVLNEFSDVDAQLNQVVQQNLGSLDAERRIKIGGDPIAFEVSSLKGDKISLEKYKGKVVLLDFWATWCAPCRQEMPNVKKVYNNYNSKGFEIIGISLDKQRSDLDNYLSKNGITWPQYYDGKFWKNDLAVKYGIQSIPATILIDKKGKIRHKSLRGNSLEQAVKKLLAE